ncbi:MAG: UDP-N-acetylmuramoyl-tripeptide--D-alanyl-D-alanine ligase [Gemmatimonadota bacterium]|nr:UDP-N-acetylmuramoyl-tripeptide--D-alanyl-D-alanine ligase [Gemmatimonadota bacterium]
MTQPFWTRDRLADALEPEAERGSPAARAPRGPLPVRGISTDTRTVRDGDCFVALVGERFDAHEFLADAVRKGARALVLSTVDPARSLGVPVYEVPDTLVALGALARYRRAAWGKTVVAVAGSNGKTTTKELLRAALSSRLEVHASSGNFNNRIGVPLTLLALPDSADIAVVELGTNLPGEVGLLREIARPDVSVVTSIGEEHLEGLHSLEGVLREESSACDGVGVAVVPASQPEIGQAARRLARRVVTAGLEDGDFRADRWGLDADGRGWIDLDGTVIRPPLRGTHNLANTMLALAVAAECGIAAVDAAAGIARMAAPPMRSAVESLGSATLLNDAYNANPPSMRAALDLLSTMGQNRQRVAVLGSMRELGTQAERLHDEVARHALASSVEILAGAGEMADALRRTGAGDPRVVTARDVPELWEELRPRLARDAVILLKASRGFRLERLLPLLTAWASH